MYDIKKAIRMQGWTLARVAEELGIKPPSLTQQITDNTISLRRCQEIADIIRCPLSEIIGDKETDFASFIRYKGIHYTADSLDEFFKQVDEIKEIAK